MADQPIHHNAGSSLATAGWETGKGLLAGLAALVGVGAALGAIGALAFGASATVIGVAALGGAIAAGIFGLTPPGQIMLGGSALLGLMRGGNRVTRENMAFRSAVEEKTHAKEHQLAHQLDYAASVGYQRGLQDGAQQVANRLRELQYEELARHMQEEHTKRHGHVAKENARREAAAAAGPQLGA